MDEINFEEDNYKLIVTGTVTPVRSTKTLDLTKLIAYFINEGYSQQEAETIVRNLVEEIIEALNEKEI